MRHQDRRDRAHARGEDQRRLRLIERRQLPLHRRQRRVAVAGVQILPGSSLVVGDHFRGVVEDERRGLVDRRRQRRRTSRIRRTGVDQIRRGLHRRSRTPTCSPLAADDRLDELVVGILVAAAHQLGQAWPPVGSIVEPAVEVERADRIVRRPDDVEPRTRLAGELRGVADGRRLERLQVLADAPASVQPRRRKRVRARRIRRGRDEDDLLDVHQRQLFDQAQQAARAIAQAMRLAAPETFGGKRDRMRLGAERQRQRGRQRIGQVVAPEPGQIEDLAAPRVGGLRGRPPDQIASPRFADTSANTRSRRASRS